MRNIQYSVFFVMTIFFIPGVLWYEQTGTLALYFSDAVPKGQLVYVISKLIGMIVLMAIAWQAIITLLGKLKLISNYWIGTRHQVMGVFILLFACIHMLTFVSAVSMRQESFAWPLFLPNFKDYYHTHLSFGLFALVAFITIAYAGYQSKMTKPKWARLVHRFYWIAIVLVYFHALAIGSEVQSGLGFFVYALLGVVTFVLFCVYTVKQFRTKEMVYS